MPSLATHTVVWLPGILVWPGIFFVLPHFVPLFAFDWTPGYQKFWQTIHPEVTPAFVLKDVVERPYLIIWLALIVMGAAIFGCTGTRHIKSTLFYIMFVTLFASRCMGTFSGMQRVMKQPYMWLQQLPWDSCSFFKGFFLSWMIQWPIWDYSYLSLYADDISTPDVATSDDISTTDKPLVNSIDITTDEKTESPRQIPFRDAMVRLAYYHIIDNALHMIWLRYFWPHDEGRPYTSYFSNSEIWSILLALEVIAWTCYRVHEHRVIQKKEVEKGQDSC